MNKKEIKEETRYDRLNLDFPICSVCRMDVVYAMRELDKKLTMKQAEKKALALDDSWMVQLAHKMANAFGDTGTYHEALNQWVEMEA
jgi:hypothetical protein